MNTSSFSFEPHTLTIIYKGNVRSDQEALGYAQPVREHIMEIDITKTPLTRLQIKEIADQLKVAVEDLVDTESDLYRDEYTDKSFAEDNWLTILVHNPELVRTPIVFLGENGKIIESGRDIIKFGASEK